MKKFVTDPDPNPGKKECSVRKILKIRLKTLNSHALWPVGL